MKREIELDVIVLWESMLRFRKKSVQETKIEKKSCRDCAYLSENPLILGPRHDFSLMGVGKTVGKSTSLRYWNCEADRSSVGKNELDSRSCMKFMRKKEGMTLEQQIEEEKQQKSIEEKERLAKEQKRLSNSLRRYWRHITSVAGIATIITFIILIWKTFFN